MLLIDKPRILRLWLCADWRRWRHVTSSWWRRGIPSRTLKTAWSSLSWWRRRRVCHLCTKFHDYQWRPSLSIAGDKCTKDNLADFVKSLTNFIIEKSVIAVKWVFSLSEYTKIDVGWPAGPLAGFKEGRFAAEGEWMGGEVKTRGRGDGNGKGEWGREGKRGKLGDSSLVAVDRRPWSLFVSVLFLCLCP